MTGEDKGKVPTTDVQPLSKRGYCFVNWGLKNEKFGEQPQVCTATKVTVFGKAEMEVDMKSLPKTNELNIFSALS